MNQNPEPFRLAPADPTRATRRRLLARLAALPAALGLAAFADAQHAEGKKTKKKNKKRNSRGGRNKKGNGGGGKYNPDAEERKFLDLINDYRRQNNAGNLSLQNQLGAAADSHSRDMAQKNYFRHAPQSNFARHGYKNWKVIGENIAAGDETAKQVFDSWRTSPPHKKNMLDKSYTEIGIGRAYNKSSKYGWYWTTTFGDR